MDPTLLDQLQTAVTGQFTSATPVVTAVILAGAALAFSIKGAFVAWRTGSKVLGKAGS